MLDEARLRRVVAQHAATSRLLGVDFVPAFRTGAVADAPSGTEPPAPEPRPTPAEQQESPVPSTSPARTGSDTKARTPSRPPGSSRDPKAVQRALDELRARYEKDAPHDQFVTDHTSIVFGEGDPCARLMFIGEAPGAEEDKTGRPFVGRAGQLLDKMIVAMGLTRESVYICNILKTRPPNNATPTMAEMELCLPYLLEQVSIVRPEAIVTLGKAATQAVLNSSEAMGRMRGRWHESPPLSQGGSIPVMPTYHPAFLLRQHTPENRAKVWSDLRQVMDRLELAPPR